MLDVAVEIKGMSLDDFIYLSETEGEFELFDGNPRPRLPTTKGHSKNLNR